MSAHHGSSSREARRRDLRAGDIAHDGRQRLKPAAQRVVVVRARVDDAVRFMVLEAVRAVRVLGVEAELDDHHAGEAERLAQPRDRLGDDAEILRDHRQRPELARRGVEHRPARAAHPAPTARVLRRRRHRPVRDEPAEVVDPRDVEQRERPPQALGPPAIARALQRRPVVQRVAPQLAEVRERVRRHAGDLPGAKQRRPRTVVGAVGRDVDRHVADEPDPALVGVRRAAHPTRGRSAPDRPPLAGHRRSAPSRRSRTPRARGSPRSRRR